MLDAHGSEQEPRIYLAHAQTMISCIVRLQAPENFLSFLITWLETVMAPPTASHKWGFTLTTSWREC